MKKDAISPKHDATSEHEDRLSHLSLHEKIERINQALPQTQCGLCDYAGCQPYAEAIISKQERIDRCPPGGVRGLLKLAALTAQDAEPYRQSMQEKEKPIMVARIREAECIGCTKCISACPTDAILGAAKQMHTIMTSECTGCELCLAPCPVDCIDMIEVGHIEDRNPIAAEKKANYYRQRYEQRQQRLMNEKVRQQHKHQQAKLAYKKISAKENSIDARRAAVADAIERYQRKKQVKDDKQ